MRLVVLAGAVWMGGVLAGQTATATTSAPATTDLAELNRRIEIQENIIRSLRADNRRLNEDVKSSTRELLSLNQQLRNLRDQSGRPAGPGPAAGAAGNAARQLGELRTDNQRVNSNNTRLTDEREAAVKDAENYAAQLRDARSEVTRLTIEVQQLRSGRPVGDAQGNQADQSAAQAEHFRAENAALTARIDDLSAQLSIARSRPTADKAPGERFKDNDQLAALQQALDAANKSLAEITAERDRLAKELASARQDAAKPAH